MQTERTRSKKYWRSLDRLLESPAVREAAAEEARAGKIQEFPAGADLAPDELTRRSVLSLMGASFALAGLEGCRRPVETIVPYVSAPELVVPGIPRHYATTMPWGTDAYGLVVESHEGRPSKIEGNELHPSSGGAASAWMQAAVLGLYDPDRARTVARFASGETEPRPSEWKYFEVFWQEREAELAETGGEGLAVLSGAYSSPSLARLRAAFQERFPNARWVVYEPLGDGNVFAGCEQATGTACRPVYHLEQAKKIVSLEADFLLAESDSVRSARGFARSRKVETAQDEMSRLYVAESSLSVTGSAADHRLRLKSREVGALAAALASELGVIGLAGAPPSAEIADRARMIAADLKASPGESLVIAGRRQPPAVHALALAINQALGAIGQTVTLHLLEDAATGTAEDLRGLVEAIDQGAVSTLLMLGGNPAYDAPGDLDFAAALAKVEHTVHLAATVDETSKLSSWHLPESHFLEAWGDARAADGTLSVVQPLIAPLHDSRSAVEVLGLLATGGHRPGYELVRETWGPVLGDDPGERAWRQALHDGVMADSASPALEVAVDLTGVAPSAGASGDGMEITFQASAAVYDGRFANLSWLHETPDSITKVTWDNAALVSPATAGKLGLRPDRQDHAGSHKRQRVRLSYRGRALELPVFVLPGQADDSIAVALGYGRSAAGRVGDGVGANAYALQSADAPFFDGGLEIATAAGVHVLAQTQENWEMHGRHLVREATLAEYRAAAQGHGDGEHAPEEHGDGEHGGDEHSNGDHAKAADPLDAVFGPHRHLDPDHSHQVFPAFDYEERPQWGMVIDLNACIGCNACVVACQSENNVPVVGKDQISKGREMQWLRVDRYFEGERDEPAVVFQPVPCMHCENAPCEQVCPVAATVHDSEGINGMTYNRCIGTRYCSNNCPYKVRRFNFFNYTKDTPELLKMANNPDVTVRSRGVMEKCTYCLQRVSEAKKTAKMAGRPVGDGEVKTACQQTCPAEAITFGDILDPASQVAHQKQLDRDYHLLAELNNRPRTSYLAKLRNPNPAWA